MASADNSRLFQEETSRQDSNLSVARSDTSLERSCLAASTAIVGETVVDSPNTTKMVVLRDRSALGVPGISANDIRDTGSAEMTESMGVGIMAQGLAWAKRQQDRRQRKYLQHQAEQQLRKLKQAQGEEAPPERSLLDNTTFRNFFAAPVDSKKCDDISKNHSNRDDDDVVTKRISKSGGIAVELAVESRKQDDASWIPPVRVVHEDDPPFCLNQQQMQSIAETVLPRGIAYCQWQRLYSLARDGDSFETSLRNIGAHKPTLLVVRTSKNEVFGGLADDSWQPASAVVQYIGGPTACLFAVRDETSVTAYKWTGANRYIQLCDTAHKRLAFGGGGNEFGLAVSQDFLHGSSGPSATFGNPALSQSSPFDICDVEIYGFLIGQF